MKTGQIYSLALSFLLGATGIISVCLALPDLDQRSMNFFPKAITGILFLVVAMYLGISILKKIESHKLKDTFNHSLVASGAFIAIIIALGCFGTVYFDQTNSQRLFYLSVGTLAGLLGFTTLIRLQPKKSFRQKAGGK